MGGLHDPQGGGGSDVDFEEWKRDHPVQNQLLNVALIGGGLCVLGCLGMCGWGLLAGCGG
jgi:hypothetical protein